MLLHFHNQFQFIYSLFFLSNIYILFLPQCLTVRIIFREILLDLLRFSLRRIGHNTSMTMFNHWLLLYKTINLAFHRLRWKLKCTSSCIVQRCRHKLLYFKERAFYSPNRNSAHSQSKELEFELLSSQPALISPKTSNPHKPTAERTKRVKSANETFEQGIANFQFHKLKLTDAELWLPSSKYYGFDQFFHWIVIKSHLQLQCEAHLTLIF